MTADDPFASVHRSAGLRRGLVIGGVVVGVAAVIGAILLVTTVPGQNLVAERLQPVQAGPEEPFGVPSQAADGTESTAPTSAPPVAPASGGGSTTPTPAPSSTRFTVSDDGTIQAPAPPLTSNQGWGTQSSWITPDWGRIYVDNLTRSNGSPQFTYPLVGQCLTRGTYWSYDYGLPYFVATCDPGALRVLASIDFNDTGRQSFTESWRKTKSLADVAWEKCFAAYVSDLNGEADYWYNEDSNLMHWDYLTDDEFFMVEPAPGRLICMELLL